MSIRESTIILLVTVIFMISTLFESEMIENMQNEDSSFLQTQENIELQTKSGKLRGTIVKDKNTGKEYIFIKGGLFAEDQLIPRE